MSSQQFAPSAASVSDQRTYRCVWQVAGCWLLVAGFCSSCGPPANTQTLRQEALKVDPGFAEVLEKRDELANRIGLLERELDLKRSQVERQIAQLRKELDEVTSEVNQKIQKTKVLLGPDVERVELDLSMSAEELRGKQAQRASLWRSVNQLRRGLKQGNSQWTQAERARMEKDLEERLRTTQRLDQEIAAINEHIRLLKIKRLLLRL